MLRGWRRGSTRRCRPRPTSSRRPARPSPRRASRSGCCWPQRWSSWPRRCSGACSPYRSPRLHDRPPDHSLAAGDRCRSIHPRFSAAGLGAAACRLDVVGRHQRGFGACVACLHTNDATPVGQAHPDGPPCCGAVALVGARCAASARVRRGASRAGPHRGPRRSQQEPSTRRLEGRFGHAPNPRRAAAFKPRRDPARRAACRGVRVLERRGHDHAIGTGRCRWPSTVRSVAPAVGRSEAWCC